VGGLVWWYNNSKMADGRHFENRYVAVSLDERHVIKNKKVALDRLRVRQNVFLFLYFFCILSSHHACLFSFCAKCVLSSFFKKDIGLDYLQNALINESNS